MATIIPPIREFPKDGRRWRIDWLGAIRPNHERAYERTIDVIISPVRDGIVNPSRPTDVIKDERQIIRIGVGQLPFLRIGTIWKNRKILDQIAGMSFQIDDVIISAETVQTISAAQQESEGKWIIPAYAHSVGKPGLWQGLNAYCIAIEHRGDPYGIILPIAEAIRFYYASSSNLAHAAFNGTFQHGLHDLINPELSGFVEGTKKCSLRLRQHIYDEEAWTIARVVNSPLANAGIKLIHDSIMVQNAEGKTPYPNCLLPFDETVSWICRGIGFNQQGQKRLLVLELLSCSASFPYDELEVTRDNDGRKDDSGLNNEDLEPAWINPHPAANIDDEAELQTGEEPHAFTQPVIISLDHDRFSALDDKEITKPPKEECQYASGQLTPLEALPSDKLGTGQGSYEEGVEITTPANVTTERPKRHALPASLEILEEVTRMLNDNEGVSASIRASFQGEYFLPQLTLPRLRQWAYLDSRKRTLRRARAINITYQDLHYCFVEIEQRKTEKKTAGLIRLHDGGPIYETSFNNLLRLLSKTEGVWSHRFFHNSKFIVIPMKHTWTSVEACTGAIFSRLKP